MVELVDASDSKSGHVGGVDLFMLGLLCKINLGLKLKYKKTLVRHFSLSESDKYCND
jgi:hypothetical protein